MGIDPLAAHTIGAERQKLLTDSGLRPRNSMPAAGDLNVRDVTMGLKKEELLRLLLSRKKTRECAEILRMHTDTVRRYILTTDFQSMLKKANESIWCEVDEELRTYKLSLFDQIMDASQAALEKMRSLIDSQDESIALRASSDILDRNMNTSKKSVNQNTNVEIKLDPAELMLAAQAALELERGGAPHVIESDGATPAA